MSDDVNVDRTPEEQRFLNSYPALVQSPDDRAGGEPRARAGEGAGRAVAPSKRVEEQR